jgi:hypothetical protein
MTFEAKIKEIGKGFVVQSTWIGENFEQFVPTIGKGIAEGATQSTTKEDSRE